MATEQERLGYLRGILALIASGRGPAPEMAATALEADQREERDEIASRAPRPGFCECGRPLGHD
jgi:hypothetical protein